MNTPHTSTASAVTLVAAGLIAAGCASRDTTEPTNEAAAEPPERIQAWMDTLTVPHHYDPETGFIVAEGVTALPAVFVTGDDIRSAIGHANTSGLTVIAVATADRCAPCQQYKLDALNDPRVIERLSRTDVIAVHIEVDRQPDLADELLGSRGIPMTYAIIGGEAAGILRGQRSAEELLAFIDSSS